MPATLEPAMQNGEPERQQLERHTTQSGFIRDAIIGLADGLTVPFALTAGLSSYVHLHLLLFTADEHVGLDQASLSFLVEWLNCLLDPSVWD